MKRNDYGFTLGGPVRIPKAVQRQRQDLLLLQFRAVPPDHGNEQRHRDGADSPTTGPGTSPQPKRLYLAFLNSDGAIPNRSIDPQTRHIVNGQPVESPFPGNAIPISRMDPVALYLQTVFPSPTYPGWNGLNNYAIPAYSQFPAHDDPIDQDRPIAQFEDEVVRLLLVDGDKTPPTATDSPPIWLRSRQTADRSYTWRVNFDDTITPTLLFHFGAGLLYFDHPVFTPPSDFDAQASKAAAAGFGGAPGGYNFAQFPANNYMPSFAALSNAHCRRWIGSGIGLFRSVSGSCRLRRIRPEGYQADREHQHDLGHGNHTFKAGADMVLGGLPAAEQHSRLRRIRIQR